MRKLFFLFWVISPVAMAAQPWAIFNGFYAGMSKAAAKSVGYTNCRQSDERLASSDSIVCDIPENKRSLGPLTASTAVLEFPSYNVSAVKKIHIIFEAKVEVVVSEMARRYGKPEDDGSYYVWHRNGPDSIELAKRQRTATAHVTFTYDKSMGDARAKNARDESKKKAILKGF